MSEKLEIRTLRHDEIQCRVSQVGKNNAWCMIVLYKDARCDQAILDETFGVFGWKRSHQLIDTELFCTVEIWDANRKQWVSKQDVGKESFTEKEKGEASDAFKRACVNVGIGRELYSAPKGIIINLCADDLTQQGKVRNNWFFVTQVEYDENRRIDLLVIADAFGRERYIYDPKKKRNQPQQATGNIPAPTSTPKVGIAAPTAQATETDTTVMLNTALQQIAVAKTKAQLVKIYNSFTDLQGMAEFVGALTAKKKELGIK